MCVAVPMKVINIEGRFCTATLGGVGYKVCLDMLPDVKKGDYIIVHAGFAIEKLDENEAMKTLELFRELDEVLQKEDRKNNDFSN